MSLNEWIRPMNICLILPSNIDSCFFQITSMCDTALGGTNVCLAPMASEILLAQIQPFLFAEESFKDILTDNGKFDHLLRLVRVFIRSGGENNGAACFSDLNNDNIAEVSLAFRDLMLHPTGSFADFQTNTMTDISKEAKRPDSDDIGVGKYGNTFSGALDRHTRTKDIHRN